jgi:hypothetical protein
MPEFEEQSLEEQSRIRHEATVGKNSIATDEQVGALDVEQQRDAVSVSAPGSG